MSDTSTNNGIIMTCLFNYKYQVQGFIVQCNVYHKWTQYKPAINVITNPYKSYYLLILLGNHIITVIMNARLTVINYWFISGCCYSSLEVFLNSKKSPLHEVTIYMYISLPATLKTRDHQTTACQCPSTHRAISTEESVTEICMIYQHARTLL